LARRWICRRIDRFHRVCTSFFGKWVERNQTDHPLSSRFFNAFWIVSSVNKRYSTPLFGEPILTGLWYEHPLPIVGMVGSALFFDTGVYLVVIGITLTIMFTITESI